MAWAQWWRALTHPVVGEPAHLLNLDSPALFYSCPHLSGFASAVAWGTHRPVCPTCGPLPAVHTPN